MRTKMPQLFISHINEIYNQIYMERLLECAKKLDYNEYESVLEDAWQSSIAGLSEYLYKMIEANNISKELDQNDTFIIHEAAGFAKQEMPKHRSSEVSLTMSLGFMKYYYEAYVDYINQSGISIEEKKLFSKFSGFILCDQINEFKKGA